MYIYGECEAPTSEVGACCTEDTCEVTDWLSCEESGGAFWGAGTDCDSAEIDCPADDGTTGPIDPTDDVDPSDGEETVRPSTGCAATGTSLDPWAPLSLLMTVGFVARRREQS